MNQMKLRVREGMASQNHHILKKSFNSVATEEEIIEQDHALSFGVSLESSKGFLVQGKSTYINMKNCKQQ